MALDAARNFLYVPSSQSQPSGQADVAKVGFGFAEFGSRPLAKRPPAGRMLFLVSTARSLLQALRL